MTTPKFSLGQCVATPGALALLEEHGRNYIEFLRRHVSGDWGDCHPSDAKINNAALNPKDPQRVMSVYKITDHDTVWLITEWDRSVTTLLLPEDY